jgi:hypothetical protein
VDDLFLRLNDEHLSGLGPNFGEAIAGYLTRNVVDEREYPRSVCVVIRRSRLVRSHECSH